MAGANSAPAPPGFVPGGYIKPAPGTIPRGGILEGEKGLAKHAPGIPKTANPAGSGIGGKMAEARCGSAAQKQTFSPKLDLDP
jgi:hypothetical protein